MGAIATPHLAFHTWHWFHVKRYLLFKKNLKYPSFSKFEINKWFLLYVKEHFHINLIWMNCEFLSFMWISFIFSKTLCLYKIWHPPSWPLDSVGLCSSYSIWVHWLKTLLTYIRGIHTLSRRGFSEQFSDQGKKENNFWDDSFLKILYKCTFPKSIK